MPVNVVNIIIEYYRIYSIKSFLPILVLRKDFLLKNFAPKKSGEGVYLKVILKTCIVETQLAFYW